MQLYGALGWPQMRAISGLTSGAAAWKEALRLAELIGDEDYQQRALWLFGLIGPTMGKSREALAVAERFSSLAVAMGARRKKQ